MIVSQTGSPSLTSDMYGRATFDISNGSLENMYMSLVDEQRAYNKHLEEREDTAYQRMVKDMTSAGLNPWTGVASGGSSSSALTPARKSALEGLIQMLDSHNSTVSAQNSDSMNAVKTGASIALGLIGLFV